MKIEIEKAGASAIACSVLAILFAVSASAIAADYPIKPVRIVVGFAPGGPTDVVARTFAEEASRKLGQQFIVENKPGANTVLAAQAVASAAPDGYTLLFAASNHTTIPGVYAGRVKFDAVRSFTPICSVASSPTVLVVGPSLPVKTLSEYMQKARSEPGKISAGSPGPGSTGHFATEMFARHHNLVITHVPYKGAAPAITDIIGGQLDSSFATLGSVLPQIKAGKLTVLAVGMKKRSALLPTTPTFEEAGGGDYSADAWYGVMAPAGTPPAIIKALEQVAIQFSKGDTNVEKSRASGMESEAVCGSAFLAQIEREVAINTRLAKELNLKID
jgi:tripartite-type tricarboxylate transporter receptor subunit TctC